MSILGSILGGGLPEGNLPPSPGDRPELEVRQTPAVGAAFRNYEDNFAVLSVRRVSDGEVEFETDRFILQSAMESRSYRQTPTYTFGESLIFTSPVPQVRVYQYSGVILSNTDDGDVRSEQWGNWRKYMSMSRGVVGKEVEPNSPQESPLIVDITFRDMIRSGYMISFATDLDAQNPTRAGLDFSMFITSEAFR